MGLSSVVVVADNIGIDTSGIQLPFTPGDTYPVGAAVQLTVRNQPFPPGPPTRVVPVITAVALTYGRFGVGQDPPPIEPEEHSLRELAFDAVYRAGSWSASGNTATLDIAVSAALRDNSPSGEDSAPDDPFIASLEVRAICIWTTDTLTPWEQLVRVVGNILRIRP